MAAYRDGDEGAYRAFLVEASDRLRAFVRRKAGNGPDLEDIVQQILIAIHEKRGTLDPARPVAPWLFAIARYRLADHWRRVYREPFGSSDAAAVEPVETAAPPDQLAEHDLDRLLGELPAAQAEAIRMTRIEGLSMKEAAERAGTGVPAMKVRVHRGMQSLKEIANESET